MEKSNMYPEMPQQLPGMPDVPPTYDQSFPTAPSSGEMAPMMPSSGEGLMPYQPQQQQQQQQQFIGQPQTILVQNVAPIPQLGPRSCLITCPSCHQQQMSNIRMEANTKTHLFALLLCVLGLCCCACIPYCVDSCKNANHYCHYCQAYLGTYNK